MPDVFVPIRLSRRDVAERLGQLYRHERLLRRFLRLLDEAERLGLPLLTVDRLPESKIQEVLP